jgi:DNA-binding NarL/FixJ family response regulator
VTVATGRFGDLVGAGLRQILSDDPTVRLVASDLPLDGLAEALPALRPAVLVLPFELPGGADRVRGLRERHAATRLVLLGDRPTSFGCREMLSAGASACVDTATEARDIVNAVHLAARGMHLLPPFGPPAGGAAIPPGVLPEPITRREAEVLEHLKAGRTNAQIAHALCIGIETVRTHTRSIYRKLGVSSRSEIAGAVPAGRVAGLGASG